MKRFDLTALKNCIKPTRRFKMACAMGVVSVLTIVMLVTLQPRQAKAVCETPITSIASIGVWIADTFGLWGNFSGALADHIINKTDTGQRETTQRVEEIDETFRSEMGEWFEQDYYPTLQEQAKQLSVAHIEETRQRGSMIDAQEAQRRKRELERAEAEAIRNLRPSESACVADTIFAGGPSGRGGMRDVDRTTDNIERGATNDAAKRSVAGAGTAAEIGMTAVIAKKFDTFVERYCHPDDNGGRMPCENPSPLANKDIEMGSSLLWGDKLTLDVRDPLNRLLYNDTMEIFVDLEQAQAIPPNLMGDPQAVYQWNMMRSTAARKQTIYSVIGRLLTSRLGGFQPEDLPAVQEIRIAARIPEEQTTLKPSRHEIMHALFEERYMQPEFAAQIVREPGELAKKNLDIQTGHLMQWNMMYRDMERLSVMYAAEFARDLEYSEPSGAGGAAPVSGDGSGRTYTRRDLQDIIDPDTGEEVPACEIINFDIPENPFRVPAEGQVFDCTTPEGQTPRPANSYSISDTGLNLIKSYESLVLCPYDDGAGYMTIGWGHLIRRGENFDNCITEAQADALLQSDLAEAEAAVKRYVTADITQSQYDALVSLVFNIGAGNFAGCSAAACGRERPTSRVLINTNNGDFEAAQQGFGSFTTAGGREFAGLVRRRGDEAALYAGCE